MNASYASLSRAGTLSGVTSGIRATLPPYLHPWGLPKNGCRVMPARYRAQRLTPVSAGAAGCDGSMLAGGFLPRVAHLTRFLWPLPAAPSAFCLQRLGVVANNTPRPWQGGGRRWCVGDR